MKRHGPKASPRKEINRPDPVPPRSLLTPDTLFAVLLGAFFGLCLLKFGNPPIMEKYVEAPRNGFELLALAPWPLSWAYWIIAFLAAFGVLVAVLNRSRKPVGTRWTLFLPLAWLLWEGLAARASISRELSFPTLLYYAVCVLCFYLGYFCLSSRENLWPFWIGVFVGFLLVLAIGLDQHFGGLQEARNFMYRQRELYPGKELPPELLKRMARNRIYSTLFYPNTLAGALLLFSPAMLLTAIRMGDRWRLGNASRFETVLVLVAICLLCLVLYLLNTHAGWILVLLVGLSLVFPVPRWIAPTALGLGILAVLFWSGSKGGWLLMLLLGLVALFKLNLPWQSRFKMDARLKIIVIALLLAAGLTGFFIRYGGFFKKGATSVSARFDYWRAAIEITKTHPFLGTGPGTFQIPYEKIKRPESEMSRLVHNDYLQQASDSGLPGFLIYTAFIVSALALTAPRSFSGQAHERFIIWLGLLGWATQCLLEFSLQIPALGWPALALLGYLLARRSQMDSTKPQPAASVRPLE